MSIIKEKSSDNPRIPRKPGQPANSKKHSDLYTDENPKDTITGLKFATVEDAEASVSKIRNSGRSHAHKIQAAVAMEQRARVMGKASAAAVYRKFINDNKKTNESLQREDLRKWFGSGKEGDWVRVGTDGKIKGDCAKEPGEGKPKCMPRSKALSMGKDARATAARRKRREDPNADRKGKPIMVNTEEFMLEKNQPTNPSLWSKAKSLAKQKFDVYPSAYANGWASKYYKSKGGSWKTVSEEVLDEKATAGLAAKAEKSGISIGVLRKVYNRGMAAWKTGHRPGTTPQQWAMARVNSYIGKGSGTYHGADKDLREVAKDSETGLPKKYVSGLSKSTSKARAAHFAANDKLSDSNPAAYKPAPGDANAKTKPSKHTLKYRAMYGEEKVNEKCWDGYKRVGMKKKGNRMVPNCVPEARDIIEKAKAFNKNNEFGTPELRKKYAAMTPGQESLTADKIPSFDPRYDDVTTQHLGLHPVRESHLTEISKKESNIGTDFKKRMQRALVDPTNIARAKKVMAKKKASEIAAKAKEPAHLVMQLRKASSIGSKVQFQDGKHHVISDNHASNFMSKYNSAKTPNEKEALQKRAHKSHSEFMKAIAEDHSPDCEPMDNMGTHHVDSYEAHRGSGDRISPVISHDDEDIRFQDFDEEAFEKELEADVHAITWEDLVDLYDEDELEYVEDYENEDEEDEEDLEEGITPMGRLKKRFNARRTKSRRNIARNLQLKRVSTPERIKSRSVRAARRMVYKRLLRNRDPSTVSAAEKTRFETQIKRLAPLVARLSVRIIPAVRKLERSRIGRGRTKKRSSTPKTSYSQSRSRSGGGQSRNLTVR